MLGGLTWTSEARAQCAAKGAFAVGVGVGWDAWGGEWAHGPPALTFNTVSSGQGLCPPLARIIRLDKGTTNSKDRPPFISDA
jgi:hypothetical protein